MALGAAMDFHDVAIHALKIGKPLMIFGMVSTLSCMFFWWRAVIREGIFLKAHTYAVQHGLRLGMALFITSEVMFFVAFFWAFFNASMFPKSLSRMRGTCFQAKPFGRRWASIRSTRGTCHSSTR